MQVPQRRWITAETVVIIFFVILNFTIHPQSLISSNLGTQEVGTSFLNPRS
jgi:hypothetical protein